MRTSTPWLVTATAGLVVIAGTVTACTMISTPAPVVPTCATPEAQGSTLCTVPAHAEIPAHTLDQSDLSVSGLTPEQAEARLAKIGRSTLPACATEDSDDCQWDARTSGNGEGRSFVTIHGVTIYTTEAH